MRYFHGKYYDNNKTAVISAILYNLRWLGVFLMVINAFPILEQGTATGLDDETAFWYTTLVIVTVCLFIFKTKYQKLVDKVTDFLDRYL